MKRAIALILFVIAFLLFLWAVLNYSYLAYKEACGTADAVGSGKCTFNHVLILGLSKTKTLFDDIGVAITAIATVMIALFTYFLVDSTEKLWAESKEAALVANRSAAIAEETLIAAHRPWLRFKAYVRDPFVAENEDISSAFDLTIENVGGSPATGIYINHELVIATLEDAIKQLPKFSQANQEIFDSTVRSSFGDTLFPGDTLKPTISARGRTRRTEEHMEVYLLCSVNYTYTFGRKRRSCDAGLYLLHGEELMRWNGSVPLRIRPENLGLARAHSHVY